MECAPSLFYTMERVMKQKRWNSIDLLRVGSFLLILIYHYMVEIEAGGLFSLTNAGITYENANLHMAKVGVTLFFMISGFGLMCSASSEFSLKTYIKKRFVRIFIPYYTVSLLVLIGRGVLIPSSVFEQNIPVWRVIFTVLGLDGYLKEYGVLTFHLGVGEWFVGCLILMYMVFPLLRSTIQKKPDFAIVVVTICYLIVAVTYQGDVPSHYFFPIKLYDFILGMYLAVKLKEPSRKYAALSGTVAIVILVLSWKLPLNGNYLNVIFCLLVFLCVFHMEDVKGITNICKSWPMKKMSQCSYEMFLVHHWAIIVMNRILRPQSLTMAAVCFVIELAAVFVVSYGLNLIFKKLESHLNYGYDQSHLLAK